MRVVPCPFGLVAESLSPAAMCWWIGDSEGYVTELLVIQIYEIIATFHT